MMPAATLTMVDGVRVVVPDSLDLITPYVLREQQDWFEDEIKFLRRLLRPGANVIDIGANYGVYALSMARTVGPTGNVWAFEPASDTARWLGESIAANGFRNVFLEQCALSSECGTAQLSLSPHSELNTLVRGGPADGGTETVRVATLDERRAKLGWHDIDFIKIDAEGEEAGILSGGERFFMEMSPLVQYEIRVDAGPHLGLVKRFEEMGYHTYRLVPGLDVLVPFDVSAVTDDYLLNLFCCKQDRALRLSAEGRLLDARAGQESDIANIARNRAYDWRETLGRLPYGAALGREWERTSSAGKSAWIEKALSLYSVSRDANLPMTARFAALETSFEMLAEASDTEEPSARLASFARVARDFGARSRGVGALQRLAQALMSGQGVDPGEPFLAPGQRFDAVAPGNAPIRDWLLGAVLEEIEQLASYSSFYSSDTSVRRLKVVRQLGFAGPEMERRWELLRKRTGAAG